MAFNGDGPSSDRNTEATYISKNTSDLKQISSV